MTDELVCWNYLQEAQGIIPGMKPLVNAFDEALSERARVATCMDPDEHFEEYTRTSRYDMFRMQAFFHFRNDLNALRYWYASSNPTADPERKNPAVKPKRLPDIDTIEEEIGFILPEENRYDPDGLGYRYQPLSPLLRKDLQAIQQALKKFTVVYDYHQAYNTFDWDFEIILPESIGCQLSIVLCFNRSFDSSLDEECEIFYQTDLSGDTEYILSFDELEVLSPPYVTGYDHNVMNNCISYSYADFAVENGFIYQ